MYAFVYINFRPHACTAFTGPCCVRTNMSSLSGIYRLISIRKLLLLAG